MGFFKEFKAFAMRGNVIDLAVGVVIGGAFGKIVSSLVSDVIMPPLGFLIGGVSFTDLVVTLKSAGIDEAGNAVAAVTLNIGNFLQTLFDFTIVAFAIFLLVKGINKLSTITKLQEEATPPPPPAPSEEQLLLSEIRDLLKERNKTD